MLFWATTMIMSRQLVRKQTGERPARAGVPSAPERSHPRKINKRLRPFTKRLLQAVGPWIDEVEPQAVEVVGVAGGETRVVSPADRGDLGVETTDW